MKKTELTCIGCPLGCGITVEQENGEILSVSGNTCPRGDAYARKEVTAPTRTVTGSVRVSGSLTGAVMVSCKTASDIPKEKVFAAAAALKNVTVPAPVRIGDILIADAAGTGVPFIATKNID